MQSVWNVKSGGISEGISVSIVVLDAVIVFFVLFFISIMNAWLGEIKAGNGKIISIVVISGLCCVWKGILWNVRQLGCRLSTSVQQLILKIKALRAEVPKVVMKEGEECELH